MHDYPDITVVEQKTNETYVHELETSSGSDDLKPEQGASFEPEAIPSVRHGKVREKVSHLYTFFPMLPLAYTLHARALKKIKNAHHYSLSIQK